MNTHYLIPSAQINEERIDKINDEIAIIETRGDENEDWDRAHNYGRISMIEELQKSEQVEVLDVDDVMKEFAENTVTGFPFAWLKYKGYKIIKTKQP